jgi:hypothetical protein
MNWETFESACQLLATKHQGRDAFDANMIHELKTAAPFVPPQYWDIMSRVKARSAVLELEEWAPYLVLSAADVLDELTQAIPGIYVSRFHCLPFAGSSVGSGDQLFLQWNESSCRVMIIFHDWFGVDPGATLPPDSCHVIADSFEEFVANLRS